MTEGYKALREGAAILDLSGRGKIKMTGDDRVRLLHAMVTNHIEQLQPGQGCYAFFLNAQGRILADVNVLCFPDHLLLDTEPETGEKIFQHLDKYIIADDVTLRDISSEIATIGIEGPAAGGILSGIGAPVPAGHYESASWEASHVVNINAAGGEGYWLLAPAGHKQDLIGKLRSAGAIPASEEDWTAVRLENGRPRYGVDLTEDYIPHETQLLRAVHFSKGCYLGQEIVERVRSRGHANKLLVLLRIDSAEPPAPGTRIVAEDKDAGVITSAAFSPTWGKAAALAYVKAIFVKEGGKLRVGESEAVISSLRPN